VIEAVMSGIRLPEGAPGPGAIAFDEVLVMDRAGVRARVPLVAGQEGAALFAVGVAAGFSATLELRPVEGQVDEYEGTLDLRYEGAVPVEAGIRLPARLLGGGSATWLIPGCFYWENRPRRCAIRYPRYDALGDDQLTYTSDTWAFSSDRAAVPAVFGWNDDLGGALCVEQLTDLGGSGLGFGGPRRGSGWTRGPREGLTPGDPQMWIDLPAREEPFWYDGTADPRPPRASLVTWHSGRESRIRFGVYLCGVDRHGYAPLLRRLEERHAPGNPTRPWMDPARAAALAAEGLKRWHYQKDSRILAETITFHRDIAGRPLLGDDRLNMHVGWLSGAPAAAALLRHGRRRGDHEAVRVGSAVLDTVASGLSPSGLFWGEWRSDRGWSGGWNPSSGWIHTRTAGEATLFLVRAICWEREAGARHPAWEAAARSNLDAMVRIQRDDGALGTYYEADTGEVAEWDGAGGLVWAAALLEAADVLAAPELRGPAIAAGEAYASYVQAEWIYGAPEDIHLAPSSEDGYNAILAYVALAERDPDPARRGRWLDLARRAADWTMTFRWTYNVAFDEHTILARYDFATRGADAASPANPHLHSYGLVCIPEQLRLATLLGDGYLRRRALDHAACFRQFIARHDGDFNARRGMTTERFHHTDSLAPKGSLLPLSHAWCLGLIVYANDTLTDLADG
jgi:hypothetical protein